VYNGRGGFHINLVTFRYPKLPDFIWAQRCASKNAVLECNTTSGKSGYFYPNAKWWQNTTNSAVTEPK